MVSKIYENKLYMTISLQMMIPIEHVHCDFINTAKVNRHFRKLDLHNKNAH